MRAVIEQHLSGGWVGLGMPAEAGGGHVINRIAETRGDMHRLQPLVRWLEMITMLVTARHSATRAGMARGRKS